MRALLILLLCSTPALAERPRPTFIDVGMKPRIGPVSAPASRIIFMHRCPPAGCTVLAGSADDSRLNISQIAEQDTTIGQFTQSDDTWKQLLSCVRDTFAPFDVMVTDVDPGPMIPHYEHIVGGKPTELRSDIPNAGGVAPATCDDLPNAMTFTFDVYGNDPLTLCWTAAQEIAHAFGLEHEVEAKDPMSYLAGPLPKRFQAVTVPCGEGPPRACACTANGMQNSYEHILAMFGPGVPTPPSISVRSPTAGKTVQPGFVVRVTATDDVAVDRVELLIDGVKIAESHEEPFTIVAPDVIAEGPHVMDVRAVDIQGTPASTTLDIVMGPPCTASTGCEDPELCVDGVCLPGPDVAGGLGYECQSDSECLSRRCLKESGEVIGYCVESCDLATAGSCPNSYECIDGGAAGGGVCWPTESSGCCDTGAAPGSPLLLTLGVFVLVLRRRRAR